MKKVELTLTTKWVIHKQHTQKKELSDGIRVEYYGNGGTEGGTIVEKQPGVFYIEWDEDVVDTPIDDSESSKRILSETGFEF